MITYNYFLNILKIPSEEEFNNIIENLPPFDTLEKDFTDYEPLYDDFDDLVNYLFDYGVLSPFNAVVDELDFPNKTVSLHRIKDLKELNEINDLLTSAGWTLENYKDREKELSKTRMEKEKKQLLSKLSNATIEQLKEFAKNVN